KLLMALGSGTGLVLILRWYWWRVNAWSEIVAMGASLVASTVLLYGVKLDQDDPHQFAYLMLGTLAITTAAWLIVTFLTAPEPEAKLIAFFERVRPSGRGWSRIAAKSRVQAAGPAMSVRLRDWICGCALIYLSLFGVGKLILGERALGAGLL